MPLELEEVTVPARTGKRNYDFSHITFHKKKKRVELFFEVVMFSDGKKSKIAPTYSFSLTGDDYQSALAGITSGSSMRDELKPFVYKLLRNHLNVQGVIT